MTRQAMHRMNARQCRAVNGLLSTIAVTSTTLPSRVAGTLVLGGVYCRPGAFMRVCRFDDNRLGIVDGDTVRDVTAALDVLPQVRYPLPTHDPLIANLPQVLARARAIAPSAPALPLGERRLL